jgi:hypothetical protein
MSKQTRGFPHTFSAMSNDVYIVKSAVKQYSSNASSGERTLAAVEKISIKY